MMRDESFRFMREQASKLLYRPTTTTFCLAPVRTQHVKRLASRFWRTNGACALGFSRSDPERSHLKGYVYPLRGLFLFQNMVSWNTLDVSPRRFLSFPKGLKKVLHACKSKQQEEAPSKQSALKSVKIMPYMESWQYIGLWQYIGPWQYIGRDILKNRSWQDTNPVPARITALIIGSGALGNRFFSSSAGSFTKKKKMMK